ncbi:hypothetical protein [Roseateles asaccharophilus]|uniref:Type II secretion system protein GspC N-terminal domain-containing protein n=1 Tax=Roseateles asaccharophilus TaxID=582607 RepID=A0ABU2ACH6_9BURK|nr:hypothetical protein [Roseateles asaccharophilus]MDR7334715.1 hypothetical protein [Roseateles asaccharophilus]
MKLMPWILFPIAAALGWLLSPATDEQTNLVQARREAWALPELPPRADQAGRAIGLAASPIFEPEAAVVAAAAAAAAAQAEDRRWRVAGIFGRDRERKVLISFVAAGKPPLRLGVGDKVPSGERITRIVDGEVLIRVGQKQVPLGADYRE